MSQPRLRAAALLSAALGFTLAHAAAPAAHSKGIQRTAAGATPTQALGVRALVIGVTDYKNLPSEQDIPTGEADASLIADTLRRTVDPADLVTLTGEQASARAIREAIRGLLQRTTEREVAMIFVETHGARLGQRGYLLGQDSQPEGRLPATGVSLDDLKKEVAASKAGSVFLFMDTVHAELKSAAGVRSGPESSVSALIGAAASARAGVFALLSEEVGASSSECPGHGAFACALSQALLGRADADGDASVTLGEVARLVPDAMRQSDAPPAEVAAYGNFDAGLAFLTPESSAELTPAAWSRPTDRVDVCLFANGGPVPADHAFKTGDRFNLSLTVPESGYLYAVNVGPDGQKNVLFPMQTEDNRVSEGATLLLVPADDPLPMTLTPPSGDERLYLVWSRRPMKGPDEALRFARAETGKSNWALASNSAVRTKGIARMATPAVAAPSSRCQSYTPQGGGDGWALDLTVSHR